MQQVLILTPKILARHIDALPAEWREVREQRRFSQRLADQHCPYGAFEVSGVPTHDGCCHEIQSARTLALRLEAVVTDFAEAVKEHCPRERVACVALVQAGVNAAARFDALQPVQHEQGTFDATEFTYRHGEAVLVWVAAELEYHQRPGDDALPDCIGHA